MEITRPLKAPSKPIGDLARLQFPLLVSDKEDGIRCIINGLMGPVSQKMLPIPNEFIRATLQEYCPNFLDGELVTLTNGVLDSFNTIQSKVMRRAGYPDWQFRVFDCFHGIYDPFVDRTAKAEKLIRELDEDGPITYLPQRLAYNLAQLQELEEDAIKRGKEGIMVRVPHGWYKEGRCTETEGFLLKVVRYMTDEAVVIALEEQMENCNVAIRDGNGLSKRSKHQANMRPSGMVGALVCNWQGKILRIGSGMDETQKIAWWSYPQMILDKRVSFQYKPHGMLDLPRGPVFKGIRHD